MGYEKNHPFVAEMYSAIPDSISPAKIGSSEQYSLLMHFARTPMRLSRELQLEGDLLESWKISPNKREFTLHFKKGQSFSNGEPITAKSFKAVLEWNKKKASALHFDFSTISSVVLPDEYTAIIKLNTVSADFIRRLIHPEFGLYYRLPDEIEFEDFKITSGPYRLIEKSPTEILLNKNPYYNSQINYPGWVSWRASGVKVQLEGLVSGSIDFAVPHMSFGVDEHKIVEKIRTIKSFDPNVGYSFFLALNPESSTLKERTTRRQIIKLLKSLKLPIEGLNPLWEKADQLYLKGGLGRPQKGDLEKIWNSISLEEKNKLPKKIKILVSDKFLFASAIIEYLIKTGINCDVVKYSNFDQYAQLIKKDVFDIIQTNNDFSSADLIENLSVALRATRPLIFTNDETLRNILKEAENADSMEEKQTKIKFIGTYVISEGLVYPIAHYKKLVYAKSAVSFKDWSDLYPDIRIYKLEVNQ